MSKGGTTVRPELARRQELAGRTWVVATAITVSALAFGTLLRPIDPTYGDQGIFLTIAARLSEGDRLYVDIWDNKDPLFYYLQSLAYVVSGWRGPFLLDVVWLALAGLAVHRIARTVRVTATGSLVLAAFVAPLLLTAFWYSVGADLLAGLSMLLVAVAAALNHRNVVAGVAVGVALAEKLPLALTALAVFSVLLARKDDVPRGRRLGAWLAGAAVLLGGVALVMSARGEFGAYARTLLENVRYANGAAGRSDGGLVGAVSAHLQVLVDEMDPVRVAALVLLAVLLAVLLPLTRSPRHWPGAGIVWALAAAGGGSAVVTLALTAIWPHHLHLLAFSATLLAIASWSAAEQVWPLGGWRRAGWTAVLACVVLLGLNRSGWLLTPQQRWDTPANAEALALDAWASRQPPGTDLSYARLGGVYDRGHAAFVTSPLRLACRDVAQYPFTQHFDDLLNCLRTTPDAVIIEAGFPQSVSGTPAGDAFASRVASLLATDFDCQGQPGGVTLCVRSRPS